MTKEISEPDRGQSHAINKGFARATGEIKDFICFWAIKDFSELEVQNVG